MKKKHKTKKLYTAIDQLSQKYGKDVFKRWENSIRKEKENPTTSFQKDFLDDYKH